MMNPDDKQITTSSQGKLVTTRYDKIIQPLSSNLTPAAPVVAAAAASGSHNVATPVPSITARPAAPQDAQTTTRSVPAQAAATPEPNAAVDLIRNKLDKIFATEPPADKERQEAQAVHFRSRHQQFMYDLNSSGKSIEEIQVAWHTYYNNLTDNQKHEVWQEFYAAQDQTRHTTQQEAADRVQPQAVPAPPSAQTRQPEPARHQPRTRAAEQTTPPASGIPQPTATAALRDYAPKQQAESIGEIKDRLLSTVQKRNTKRSKGKQHLQSLAFGLSLGGLAVIVMLFGFFNERFIAPFMTPSRAISSTTIIIDPSTTTAGSEPKIIIPKINVEVPVLYDINTIDEKEVEKGLEQGTVHYFNTSDPGELGNGVIFGHSSSNILNSGKYKFAFVLLRKLEKDDLFYLDKDGKRFVYRVYDKKIVPPSEVSVLYRNDKPATMTLITCDPPGTNTNRLVVVGEQITPDPSSNAASTTKQQDTEPATLPSDSPSLWSRIWGN